MTPELQRKIVNGVLDEANGHSIDELVAQRDSMLFGLLAVRTKYARSSQWIAEVGQSL